MGKGYDLATAEERDIARERATVQVGAPRQQGAPQREEDQLPEWWNPTPALHVSLYYKEEVRFASTLCAVLNCAGHCMAAAIMALSRCSTHHSMAALLWAESFTDAQQTTLFHTDAPDVTLNAKIWT